MKKTRQRGMHKHVMNNSVAPHTHTMLQQKNNPRKRVGGMSRKVLKYEILLNGKNMRFQKLGILEKCTGPKFEKRK